MSLWNKRAARRIWRSGHKIMRIQTWVCCFLLSTAAPLGAGERLTIAVSPAQSFAPSDLMVRVHVAPDAANRALVIVADGDNYYRSSVIQIDGESGPRMMMLELRSVPGGDYEIRAAVVDGAGHELGSVRKQAVVLGGGD
jgi:hypothetical protein